jgi:hypothetical protein
MFQGSGPGDHSRIPHAWARSPRVTVSVSSPGPGSAWIRLLAVPRAASRRRRLSSACSASSSTRGMLTMSDASALMCGPFGSAHSGPSVDGASPGGVAAVTAGMRLVADVVVPCQTAQAVRAGERPSRTTVRHPLSSGSFVRLTLPAGCGGGRIHCLLDRRARAIPHRLSARCPLAGHQQPAAEQARRPDHSQLG